VRVQLIHNGREGDEAEQDFALILHIAHIVGEGASCMLVLRYLLAELGAMRRELAFGKEPLTSMPLSFFHPLSAYPSADDLMDARPTLRRLLHLIWGDVKEKVLKIAPHKTWDGDEQSSLVQLRSEHPEDWITQANFSHVPAATLKLLSAEGKRRGGVTLHGVLSSAAAFAAGVSSVQETLRIKSNNPISTRRFCRHDAVDLSTITPHKPHELLGNFVASHSDVLLLDSRPNATPLSFWSEAAAYLRRLRADERFSLETNGLLGLVDVRSYMASSLASLRRRRNASVEVSNLGLVGAAESESNPLSDRVLAGADFQLLDAYFAQPAGIPHAVFASSCVSTPAGGLRVAHTSVVPGIVSPAQAQLYKRAFDTILQRAAQGKEVEYKELRSELRAQLAGDS